jgi:plasmid replication initiation protein
MITKKKAIAASQFVIKSNSLIEARYRLSLQESQLILWLLMQIQPDDEDFKPHRLEITEFARIMRVEAGNRYQELRKITKRLMQRIMEIYKPEEGNLIQIAWLSSATYETKKGYVLLTFDPSLKPYLLQLKSHFTKINIADTLKLKSIYAVRIFELLLQYASVGKREISIKDLRSYCGVEDSEYQLYADLKRKVIQKALTEINRKTEYEINYKEIKESRKVVAIEWTIKKKSSLDKLQETQTKALIRESRFELALVERLIEYGFGKIIAKRLITNHGEALINNALKAVDLQVEKGMVKNGKAMLQTAIKEQWHPEKYAVKKKKAV